MIFLKSLQFGEQKDKRDFIFSKFEKRKINSKIDSPLSRRERERNFPFLKVEEEKEIIKNSPISRREREIYNSFPQFQEETF